MRSRIVIAPNWIGDAVMAIPFLRALKRSDPSSPIAVLAKRGPASIFAAEGSAEAVLVRSTLISDSVALRRGKFSEAWLLPNSFRAALTAFLGGVPERVGYGSDRRASLLTRAVLPRPRTGHQLRDYDALLAARGIEPDLDSPRLEISAEAGALAADAFAAAGWEGFGPVVLLAPGAAFSWTKRWPEERFGQLASQLTGRGFRCGIVIGPGEEALAEKVSTAAMRPLPTFGADLDPVGIAAILARAQVAVSNDSGPMHLAAAVGTPVVAFFGPTDPGRTAPTGAPSRILDRYVFCSPCFLKECPFGHECMREISVEQALAAVEGLISQSR